MSTTWHAGIAFRWRTRPKKSCRVADQEPGLTEWRNADPLPDETTLLAASDETWRNLAEADWMEAFRSHPRIGETRASGAPGVQSLAWSKQEQQSVTAADDNTKIDLAEANKDYEERFTASLSCAPPANPAAEILEILRHRLRNDDETELHEAAEQQRQITHIPTEEMALAMNRISTHVLDTARGKPAQVCRYDWSNRKRSGNWLAAGVVPERIRMDAAVNCSQTTNPWRPASIV